MKTSVIRLFAFGLLLVGLAWPVAAQMPGGQTMGNAALLKLFSDFTGFAAKADMRVYDKETKEPTTMQVDFSMLDGQVRMDLDMATLKTKQVNAQTLASLKTAGLDKVVTILRPQRKSAIISYPAVRSYVEMPLSPDEVADMAREFKVEKTKTGRESIDGHPCDKTKVVLTAGNGEKQEAVVWYNPTLKDFPVKIQMDQRQMSVVMQYRDVRLVRPDAHQFEAPMGFTKHASNEQLMQAAMLKAFTGGKPK
jgi:hypothetical protein